jgi:hypothetical protein
MTTYMDEDVPLHGQDLCRAQQGKIYKVFEDALIRYLEETGRPEASREEMRDNGAYEERQPQPRVPSFPVVRIRR